MCTVTYLPWQETGFILTSNRDEHVGRPLAEIPKEYCVHEQRIIFPKDPKGGGTWIAISNNGIALCLLNGAFAKHTIRPPYRISRGKVLLDFFAYNSVERFISSYDFNAIEPFTLIVVQPGSKLLLTEICWDEKRIHVTDKDPAFPHIWSSVTLYSAHIRQQRKEWFTAWQKNNPLYGYSAIRHFHYFTKKEDKCNGLLINRNNELVTVSITSIVSGNTASMMVYEDLIRKMSQIYHLKQHIYL